jgi:hypothetical protein
LSGLSGAIMKRVSVLTTVTLAFLGYASAVSAAVPTLDYDLFCTSSAQICSNMGGGTASFQLPQFPVPDHAQGDPFFFSFNAVPGILNGQSVTFEISFPENNPGPGGIELTVVNNGMPTNVNFGFAGPQLFQGLVASPLLVAGEFAGRGFVTPSGEDVNFGLTVTLDDGIGSAPVPELATWAMMLIGFTGLGFTGWRRVAKDRPEGGRC